MLIFIFPIACGEAHEESLSQANISPEKEWLNKAEKLQEKDKAIEACTKALEINPEYIKAYELRARFYQDKKEYYLAREDYTRLIELNSKEADQYYLKRGLVFEAERQYDNAKNDLTKAIELNPNFRYAYNVRGLLLRDKLKKYDEAIGDFTKLIELEPYNTAYYVDRASIYEVANRMDLAIKDYSKLIELKPNRIWYISRADLYEKNSQYDMAINDYTKAIELSLISDLDDIYIKRAVAYDKLGKADLAQADRTKVEDRRKAERNWVREWGFMILWLIPPILILCLSIGVIIGVVIIVRNIIKKK